MRLGVVYKVSIGENFIIGSSLVPNERELHYRGLLKNNKWNNPYVQNSWNKYREDAFEFNILQYNIPENILEHVEDIWIGSLCGRIEDDSGGMNMRDAFRARFGEETKKKMSDAKLGKKFSEERKLKLIQTATKASIEKSNKRVYQYSLEGKYLNSFISVAEASRVTGISRTTVGTSAISNGNNRAGEYLWSYKLLENIPKYTNSPAKSRRRKVNQYDLQKNFIKEWESVSKVQKDLGYSGGNIYSVLVGKRNSAYNSLWEFV